jgi:hypothetical protein
LGRDPTVTVSERKEKSAYDQSCRSAQRMGQCDGIPGFDPPLGLLFFGLGRSAAHALGRKFYSLLGGSVAFMNIAVSHIPPCSQVT